MASILLIEDTVAVRALFRTILESGGHRVREASHGSEGVREFRKCPTEVVITDIYMPDGDGLEVICQLRRDCPAVKILAVSGRIGPDEMLSTAQLLGANGSLPKRVGVQDLLTAVANLVSGAHNGPPLQP